MVVTLRCNILVVLVRITTLNSRRLKVEKHYYTILYRVSQKEETKLRESVPYVKIYRYNPKHLYPKLNGYGDNGLRKV
jgi:hypothetical protein